MSLWPPSSRRISGFGLSCLPPSVETSRSVRPVTHGRPRGRSDWLNPEQRGRRQGQKREELECISLPGSPFVSVQGQTALSWSQNPSEGARWCTIRPPDPSPTSCFLFSSWILPSRFFSLLCPLLWFLALICRPHGLHSLALTSQAPRSAIYFSLFFCLSYSLCSFPPFPRR